MTIKEIRTAEEFEKLEREWNALLTKSEYATVFQTWEWLFTWWKHFSTDKSLLILLAYDDFDLTGIAPLYITRKLFGPLPLRTIEFLGYGEKKNSEYLDFITRPDIAGDVALAFSNYLLKKKNDWDVLHLTNLPDESKTITIFESLSKQSGILPYREYNLACPYIMLPDTMDQFLKTVKYKQRGRLKNQRNQLFNNFHVEILCWDKDRDLDIGLNTLFELHSKRFRSNSVFDSEINRRFSLEVSSELYRRKILKLYLMKINGEYACAMYCLNYNNRIIFYQSGYDPKWLKQSALSVLIFSVIEQAIFSKLKVFDFGRGMEKYKLIYTKTFRITNDLMVFKIKFFGIIFMIGKASYRMAKRAIHKIDRRGNAIPAREGLIQTETCTQYDRKAAMGNAFYDSQ